MDSLIAASARALAGGDALGALKRIALARGSAGAGVAWHRDGAVGRAFARTRVAAPRSSRLWRARRALSRARCVVAEAEVALAMRDFSDAPRALAAALATLEAHADHANALQAHLIAARRLLLLGRLDEARTDAVAAQWPQLVASPGSGG
jgi:hypothetical protein